MSTITGVRERHSRVRLWVLGVELASYIGSPEQVALYKATVDRLFPGVEVRTNRAVPLPSDEVLPPPDMWGVAPH